MINMKIAIKGFSSTTTYPTTFSLELFSYMIIIAKESGLQTHTFLLSEHLEFEKAELICSLERDNWINTISEAQIVSKICDKLEFTLYHLTKISKQKKQVPD